MSSRSNTYRSKGAAPERLRPPVRRPASSRPPAGLRARIAGLARDTRGFMLAEQLVSIVFIGMLCIVVAAGLGAALAAYGSITTASNANMLLSQTVQEVNDELAFSLSADADSGAFVSATTRTSVTMETGVTNKTGEKGIVLEPAGEGGAQVMLVTTTNGLTPAFTTTPAYEATSNTWTYAVAVLDSSGVVRAKQDMKVARVNPAQIT